MCEELLRSLAENESGLRPGKNKIRWFAEFLTPYDRPSASTIIGSLTLGIEKFIIVITVPWINYRRGDFPWKRNLAGISFYKNHFRFDHDLLVNVLPLLLFSVQNSAKHLKHTTRAVIKKAAVKMIFECNNCLKVRSRLNLDLTQKNTPIVQNMRVTG